MRTNCPVCGKQPIDSMSMSYAVPDGWHLPRDYEWKLCTCGFIWADTSATAEDFDNFYRANYAPHIDEHDIARMRNLASHIFANFIQDTRIIDYGGVMRTLNAIYQTSVSLRLEPSTWMIT